MIPADENGRVCDVCGRLRLASRCRNIDRIWVCDRHPNYISRIGKERLVRPVKLHENFIIPDARPLVVRETLESVEADALKFICEKAPIDICDWTNGYGVGGSETPAAAAWAALYLADLVIEDKRPYAWIDTAETKLTELADWLVAQQNSATSSDLAYGGFLNADTYYHTEDAGAAGLALLRAYQALGTTSYLDAAKRCAWFLRSCQCGDKLTSYYSSSDAAGTGRKHWGAWTHLCSTTRMDHRYYPGDLIGYEFLYALYQECGDLTIGSSVTGGTPFATSREALLSVAINEATDYWTAASGFTTATPYEYFDSYPTDKDVWTGTGAWAYSDGLGQITSRNWALGLRAISYVSGTSAAADRFAWLAAFTSNPDLEQDAITSGRMQMGRTHATALKDGRGTYDANSCPAVTLQVYYGGAAVTYNADALYDLAALGHLAALYSSQHQTDFVETRETIGRPQAKFRDGTPRDNEYIIPLLMGRCGLGLQPWSDASATQRYGSVARCAQAARVFRVAPQIFQMRGIAA